MLEALPDVRIVPAKPDYAEEISSKQIRAAVEIPEGFDAKLASGEPMLLKIYMYEGDLKSGFGADRLQKFFRDLRERAIRERKDFAFETTLGGSTMPRLLSEAASQGFEVRIWYVGLASADLHIARVRNRVRAGGHDIPESSIRRRWRHSRLNLVQLQPHLTELRVYDNSADADPAAGHAPLPVLVLHLDHGEIVGPPDLSSTPEWAKPIVAAALKVG